MRQLMHSFHGLTAPDNILQGVQRGDISAFCLFNSSNLHSPAQTRRLAQQLQQAAQDGRQPPVIIGIDQEGGQLMALANGTTPLPGNMALGATRSAHLAQEAGRLLGRELLAMGINMNFAPAVDVNVNPANPVIGVRSFGASPQLVGELGAAMIQGMQDEGVIAVAKHYPGHGDTAIDSHHAAAVVPHERQRLDEIELAPFADVVKARVGGIMTAHVIYSALDADQPATLSRAVVHELLRETMGYEGLILTDAMDMHAVAQYGDEESCRRALQAGCDLILMGHIREQMAFNHLLKSDENPAALQRIEAARQRIPQDWPDLAIVGSKEHIAIAQTIADASITVVRDEGRLPLNLQADETIAVITPRPENLTPADTSADVAIQLPHAISARHTHTLALEMPLLPSESDIRHLLEAVDDVSTVIIGTIQADQHAGQAALVKALHERGQAPIVVALRTPYDLTAFPMVATYVCGYSIRPVTMEAIARVLFGEIQARGILPCPIPGITPQYPSYDTQANGVDYISRARKISNR